MKKINLTKTYLEKKTSKKKHMEKHCSKAKIMWENTVAIYSVLNNYKAKFSISLIYIKKYDKDNSEKKSI